VNGLVRELGNEPV
jgi:hypothetical protein